MDNLGNHNSFIEMGKAAMSGGDMIVNGSFVRPELAVSFGQGKEKPENFKIYLLQNYKSILPKYLSDGLPSSDTCKGYFSDIDLFLKWCGQMRLDPYQIQRRHMIFYRAELMDSNLKTTTIKHRLTAIHRFYYVLQDFGLIMKNPVDDIRAHRNDDSDSIDTKFFTASELKKLLDNVKGSDEVSLRLKSILMLMGLEGLRSIEVHRMNSKDVNFVTNCIFIRGKGHNDNIVIRKDTAEVLKEYMKLRMVSPKESPIPVFVSVSNRAKGFRLSRHGIRKILNDFLLQLDMYQKGHSCHKLRHTAGTLLYSATKDLNYVKKALRHKDLVMASRYSHIIDSSGQGLSRVIDLNKM